MWEQVLAGAINNGLWSALFVCLLIYQLTDSRKRESKYQATIASLSEHLSAVKEIKNDLKEIKEDVNTLLGR